MEKLKGQEIQALARTLYSQLNKSPEPITLKEKQDLLKTEEVVAYNKAVKKVKAKFPNVTFLYELNESYASSLLFSNRKVNKSSYNSQQIADMIILEQIEAKDLESLKKAILKKLEK
jgi:hypothetical protein